MSEEELRRRGESLTRTEMITIIAELEAEAKDLESAYDKVSKDYGTLHTEAEALRQKVADAEKLRDHQWEAELETGYNDCPPRNPGEVTKWWASHFAFVDRLARAAAIEELSRLDIIDLAALRKVILACDENVGPDGGCDCTKLIASKFADDTKTLRQQVADAEWGFFHADGIYKKVPKAFYPKPGDLWKELRAAREGSQ